MSNLNKTLGLDQIGLNRVSKIHRNLNIDNLIDEKKSSYQRMQLKKMDQYLIILQVTG